MDELRRVVYQTPTDGMNEWSGQGYFHQWVVRSGVDAKGRYFSEPYGIIEDISGLVLLVEPSKIMFVLKKGE